MTDSITLILLAMIVIMLIGLGLVVHSRRRERRRMQLRLDTLAAYAVELKEREPERPAVYDGAYGQYHDAEPPSRHDRRHLVIAALGGAIVAAVAWLLSHLRSHPEAGVTAAASLLAAALGMVAIQGPETGDTQAAPPPTSSEFSSVQPSGQPPVAPPDTTPNGDQQKPPSTPGSDQTTGPQSPEDEPATSSAPATSTSPATNTSPSPPQSSSATTPPADEDCIQLLLIVHCTDLPFSSD